jgi:hypothetical protein
LICFLFILDRFDLFRCFAISFSSAQPHSVIKSHSGQFPEAFGENNNNNNEDNNNHGSNEKKQPAGFPNPMYPYPYSMYPYGAVPMMPYSYSHGYPPMSLSYAPLPLSPYGPTSPYTVPPYPYRPSGAYPRLDYEMNGKSDAPTSPTAASGEPVAFPSPQTPTRPASGPGYSPLPPHSPLMMPYPPYHPYSPYAREPSQPKPLNSSQKKEPL